MANTNQPMADQATRGNPVPRKLVAINDSVGGGMPMTTLTTYLILVAVVIFSSQEYSQGLLIYSGCTCLLG